MYKSLLSSVPTSTIKRCLATNANSLSATNTSPSASATTDTPIDAKSTLNLALTTSKPLNNWSREQISSLFNMPLNDLMFYAQLQHRQYHNPREIQLCTLLSIKTGGCSEDCKYCAQSSKNDTGLKATKLLDLDTVYEKAKIAKLNNSTRFCMGSAWRDMKGRKSALRKIAEMVNKINNELKMETCVTLGMINEEQAKTLKDAGLTAYNHNIDTSRNHYKNIISTRSYDERLQTIKNVNESGIKACTGGILGMGETIEDHIDFIHTLSTMSKHPESLPINKLIAIKGTPMEEELKTKYKDRKLELNNILRVISTARLVMPESIIRLAAGRYTMKEYEQLLCFNAGVNAIFTGEKMLTTMCTGWDEDIAMLKKWGYVPMEAFKKSQPRDKLNVKIDDLGLKEINLKQTNDVEPLEFTDTVKSTKTTSL
ncbi:biotin synthase [Pichia californica]|uniref:biotin synthase n=1 Tax=Pichia californica TaxID=460514 RepID=A0A9P6WIG2_9ASCO|nr:biotin synthase [[Candida] californica]KAG0687750.1 biotin synthase [[Candida] californica]